jgi:hypothetical protein
VTIPNRQIIPDVTPTVSPALQAPLPAQAATARPRPRARWGGNHQIIQDVNLAVSPASAGPSLTLDPTYVRDQPIILDPSLDPDFQVL